MTQVAAQLGRDRFSRPVWLYGPHPLQWKWPLWCSLGRGVRALGVSSDHRLGDGAVIASESDGVDTPMRW